MVFSPLLARARTSGENQGSFDSPGSEIDQPNSEIPIAAALISHCFVFFVGG
jgi:hypothetical protein